MCGYHENVVMELMNVYEMIHIRPLGLFFVLTFLYWFYKNVCSCQIIPPDKLQMKFYDYMERIERTRLEKPGLFCLVASSALGVMAILGHYLSGSTVVLICLVAAVIVTAKYNFKILKIKKIDNKSVTKVQDNDFDEFMPEINESNMSLLERASDQSTSTLPAEEGEEKSEEIPSFLMIPGSIPEVDENSTDEDDPLGLGVPEEINAQNTREIEFKKGHFKKDSSISTSSTSSDEENLSKGLKFPGHSEVDHGSTIISKQQSELNQQMQQMTRTLLPSLVTGLVSWAGGSSGAANYNVNNEPHRLASQPDDNEKQYSYSDFDDSDYEIVNTDEYQ